MLFSSFWLNLRVANIILAIFCSQKSCQAFLKRKKKRPSRQELKQACQLCQINNSIQQSFEGEAGLTDHRLSLWTWSEVDSTAPTSYCSQVRHAFSCCPSSGVGPALYLNQVQLLHLRHGQDLSVECMWQGKLLFAKRLTKGKQETPFLEMSDVPKNFQCIMKITLDLLRQRSEETFKAERLRPC